MSDTCAHFADIGEKVLRGDASPYVSPNLAKAANRCATAGDIRARRLFLDSYAAFRSNVLDAADLGPAIREQLLTFLAGLGSIAPTSASMDEAMAKRAKQ